MEYKDNMNLKYKEVNNLWKDIKIPYITRVEAGKAKNLLIRKFGCKRFMPPNNNSMKGKNYRVRKTWICLSGNSASLRKGWRDLIHEISHWVYWKRFPNRHFNHSYQQAEIEYEMCKFVINTDWLDGSLKPKVKALSRNDKFNIKIKSTQNLIKLWLTKQVRAKNKLKKLNCKLKRLQKSVAN